jgi:YT521-B-like domain
MQDGRTVLLIFSIHGSGGFQGIARVTEMLTAKPAKEYLATGLAANIAIEWLKKFVQFIFREICNIFI